MCERTFVPLDQHDTTHLTLRRLLDDHAPSLPPDERTAVVRALTNDLLPRLVHRYQVEAARAKDRRWDVLLEDLTLRAEVEGQNALITWIATGAIDDPIGACRDHLRNIDPWCWVTVTNGHGIEIEHLEPTHRHATIRHALAARTIALSRTADRLLGGPPPPA